MYDRIIAEAMGTPWAILPEKLAEIEAFLHRKAAGEVFTEAEIEAAAAKDPRGAGRVAPAGVGLIPIMGTITQRATFMSRFSGGASTEAVGMALDAMVADPNIGQIILEIDSPGGSVFGVAELADKIAAARQQKPVVAVVNSLAASAAYWIASAASEIIMTPAGQVGSIGVFKMHIDESKWIEAQGVKISTIKAGRLKALGGSHEPLSEDARAALQKSVDDYYKMFVAAVARGRKVPESLVSGGFGEGDTVRAQEALSLGMVDKIGTLDSVLARYGFSSTDMGGGRADSGRPNLDLRKRRLAI